MALNRNDRAAIRTIIKANEAATGADGVPFWTISECLDEAMDMLNALERSGDVIRKGGSAVMQRRYSWKR